MRLTFSSLILLGVLALCLAVPRKGIRWCTKSRAEKTKCSLLQKYMRKQGGPPISCVRKPSIQQCALAIARNKADAMTVDGGLLFQYSQDPYNLKPVAAEVYGTPERPQTHYYAVAVARKGSSFQLNQLRGLKSCHTGLGRTAGWNIPIGTLRSFLNWKGPPKPLEEAVAKFFSGSCVPGADGNRYPSLCQLCVGTGKNKCAFSSQEPYFGYSGAFRCLRDGAGDVAFIRQSTVFEDLPDKAARDEFELLCPDNTRRPVGEYEQCHLARVPSHAVVARSVNGREDDIWNFLNQAQEKFGHNKSPTFKLFGSLRGQKDLLFKDSAIGFLRVPKKIDAALYLGFSYVTALRNMGKTEAAVAARESLVVWCAVGSKEQHKCNQWSHLSNGNVACASAPTTEDCITLILKGDADAMSLDGGYIYTAGKCGLVPVLAENPTSREHYNTDCVNRVADGYPAVAVVKTSNPEITWNNLEGRKSCHTAVGRTAGWNIPMGLLLNRTGSCKFDEVFSQSCAPGAEPDSLLCALCVGNEMNEDKCMPNNNERYYGYTGAFRCLAEDTGDVAFIKPITVLQNTNGNNREYWAMGLRLEDFELLCLDGSRKPVTEAKSCHLAVAPNHAVVSRKDKVERLEQVLLQQQAEFGKNGSECLREFCLFKSDVPNLLFNDNTECLARLPGKPTYEQYLGSQYVAAIGHLQQCSTSPLLEACAFLGK
ncbi:lactotransferrin isoform X2 [Ochotona princeps]|uniref:lactotransferrin isoform X2 n=1 Tax=Ochotona princeps TaxID=9978 RepID=UPI002715343C|nr:lactotransferrin isoform X2 [Ochotona princeps]